jgi:hypothetical protein
LAIAKGLSDSLKYHRLTEIDILAAVNGRWFPNLTI